MFQALIQHFYVLVGGRPSGYESYCAFGNSARSPHLETDVLPQSVDDGVRQYEELLVRRRIHRRTETGLFKGLPQLHGLSDSFPADAEIKSVIEQGLELKSEKPALCQKRSVLFDQGREVFKDG